MRTTYISCDACGATTPAKEARAMLTVELDVQERRRVSDRAGKIHVVESTVRRAHEFCSEQCLAAFLTARAQAQAEAPPATTEEAPAAP